MLNAASASALIERIYEAAVATSLWPGVLQDIGTAVGAQGAVFIAVSELGTDWVCAPALEDHMAAYEAAGWAADPEHTAPLFADTHAGFRAETAYRSIEEIEALPVKRDFMIPRGLIAAAASVFQGVSDDALYMTVEGFQTHGAAERAVTSLDLFRPHVGRALSLSAKVRQARTDAVIAGLELAGVPAAIIDPDRRLKAVNQSFETSIGPLIVERFGRVAFNSAFLQTAVEASLTQPPDQPAMVASVAVQVAEDESPSVLHLLPLRGTARNVCGSDGILVLAAKTANQCLPKADLLRLLFDLTPAEARVARLIAAGRSVDEIARASSTSELTVRTQLRAIFSKTGVQRQAQLVRLLGSIGAPGAK